MTEPIIMKHEEIRTEPDPARPTTANAVAALQQQVLLLAQRLAVLTDIVQGMQQTQARTIERMLSLHEDPQ